MVYNAAVAGSHRLFLNSHDRHWPAFAILASRKFAASSSGLRLHSSSQSSSCAAAIIRFGSCGFRVPAATFELSASLVVANALASCSVRNVSVARSRADLPGCRSLSSNETYQPSERERRLISSPSEWLHSATLIKGDPDTSLLALNDGTAMSKIVSWYNQDEFVGNAEGRRDLKGGARFREIAKHNRSRSRRRLWIRTSIRVLLQRVEFHSS